MRETKEQKIVRLERKVGELSQIIKDKIAERKAIVGDYKREIE